MEKVTLSNGYQVPIICMGTDIVDYRPSLKGKAKITIKSITKAIWKKDIRKHKKNQGIIKCCNHALDYGCTFFDTSRAYGGSERMIQDALKKPKREHYFICTKLDNYSQLHDISAREVLKESMKQLGVDYVDVYLLHWLCCYCWS